MSEGKALVPKLRFPEFRGAGGWPQQQLGSVAAFFKGKGLPKSAITPDGKRPCIHYGELFTVYPEVIGAVKSRTNSEEDVFLSAENDVLMPTSDVTPSGLAKACCLNSENVILGGDILIIRTEKRSINGEFLARYIRHLERKVLQLVSGSTVFHLYASSMEKLELSFPPEHAEQQKIADCLSSLDELIAAQARKVDALKTHKKGLMQQLFPREGETQQRLRFPEFRDAGDWTGTTFGAAATFINGKAYKQEELLDQGKYRVLRVGNFFTSKDWYFSDLELEANKYCDRGDLLYAWSASFGPRIWAGEKVIYHYHIWKVIEASDIDKQFLFLLLDYQTERMKAESSNGLGLLHITKGTIEAWECCIPKKNEQLRIADCITSLDTLITAATQELETLKTHKKGLMQQLFPSVGGVAGEA